MPKSGFFFFFFFARTLFSLLFASYKCCYCSFSVIFFLLQYVRAEEPEFSETNNALVEERGVVVTDRDLPPSHDEPEHYADTRPSRRGRATGIGKLTMRATTCSRQLSHFESRISGVLS